MLSAYVQVQLTDDELWHAIVQNTDSMSALIHQQVDRFAREYAAYTAEIRRRHPF